MRAAIYARVSTSDKEQNLHQGYASPFLNANEFANGLEETGRETTELEGGGGLEDPYRATPCDRAWQRRGDDPTNLHRGGRGFDPCLAHQRSHNVIGF